MENRQRNMTVATRNTYQGSSTAVFILVFISQMVVLFVFHCVSVWKMEGHVLKKNHVNNFLLHGQSCQRRHLLYDSQFNVRGSIQS